VRIGRHAVIGAGSVVTRDVPDYCVAAGNPARVLRRYDFERRAWLPVSDSAPHVPSQKDEQDAGRPASPQDDGICDERRAA
jgi:serine acetyltransferase